MGRPGMKVCPKCGRELPAEAFYPCKKSRDGLRWQCRECDRAYSRAYQAAVTATSQLRVELNRKVREREQSRRTGELRVKECEWCGKPFEYYDGRKRMCSDECREAARSRAVEELRERRRRR